MFHRYCLILFLLLAGFSPAAAEQGPGLDQQPSSHEETKELSGMSIVGNDEAPKSLYIVPWKSSELGEETSMNMMLNEQDMPVDREVFMRQLDYYEVSTAKPGPQQ